MIHQGRLCRSCTNSVCRDAGTPQEPILIECPKCAGEGCEECDEGRVAIDGCPNQFCRDVGRTVPMIDLFHKGLPPVAGGVLDQAAWFLEAARYLDAEEAALKAEQEHE